MTKDVSTKEMVSAFEYGSKMFRMFENGKDLAAGVLALEGRGKTLAKDIEALVKQKSTLDTQVNAAKTYCEEAAAEAQFNVNHAKDEAASIIEKAKAKELDVIKKKKELIASLEADTKAQAKKLDDVTNDVADAERELAAMNEKIATLKNSLGSL